MFSNTYIAPNISFARSNCLAVSEDGTALCLADYYLGYIYTYDGINLVAVTSPGAPNIFGGTWVRAALLGQILPLTYFGGPPPIDTPEEWIEVSPGSYELSLNTTNIGTIASQASIPGLSYTVQGTETFIVNLELQNILPTEILIELYESNSGLWHRAWWGTSENFGLQATFIGLIPPVYNQIIQLTFTAAEIGLITGNLISGVGFGLWSINGSSTVLLSAITVSGTPVNVDNYVAVTQFGASVPPAFFVIDQNSTLVYIPNIGGISPLLSDLSSTDSIEFTGLTSYNNYAYFINSVGALYQGNIGFLDLVTNAPATFTRGLVTDNNGNFFTVIDETEIGTYNIGGNDWTTEASPFPITTDIYYPTNVASGLNPTLIIAGRNLISMTQNVSGLAYSAETSQILATDPVANEINIYDDNGGGWSLTQSVSGMTGPTQIVSTELGDQALAISSSKIGILTNEDGFWELSSLISSGANAIAIVPNSEQALVCQQSLNKIVILDRAGNAWTPLQTLNFNDPISLCINPNSFNALVGSSSGISIVNNASGIWNISNSFVSLTTPPSFILTDQVNENNPNFYVIGAVGGVITVLTLNDSLQVQNSYSFSGGSASGALIINYQVVINTASGIINIGTILGNFTSESNVTSGISDTNTPMLWIPDPINFMNYFLIGGLDSILEYYNNRDLHVARTYDSLIAIASGAVWNLIDLMNRSQISALTTDVSGTIYAATTNNAIYKASGINLASGYIASGYPYILTPPTDQESGVPIGVSQLVWYLNQLYASSSLYGGLIQINTD